MAKITKQEFENWSKDFKEKIMKFVNSDYGYSKLSSQEVVEFTSIAGNIEFFVEKQNPFAVMVFTYLYESLPGHDTIKNEVYPGYDGLTVQQWLDNIRQKVKEHCEADGYYKSSEPIDKSALLLYKKLFSAFWLNLNYEVIQYRWKSGNLIWVL